MREGIFEILENEEEAMGIYRLVIGGDCSAVKCSGQFINVKIDGTFLRRPFSIADCDGKTITAVYRTVGEGTAKLSTMKVGEKLNVLTGLGNGFDKNKSGDRPLLIGGGSGVASMYMLCRELCDEGKSPIVVLGFAKSDEVHMLDDFVGLEAEILVTTEDGEVGEKGRVTDVIGDLTYSYIYSCGSEAMMEAIAKMAKTSGEFSFEARMGCGFGACMGCTCETKYGKKRICKDGPVLEMEEIIW